VTENTRGVRVLFVGGCNSRRSAMAEAFLRNLRIEQLHVESAGVQASKADPRAIQVMHELGLDLGSHVPRAVSELSGQTFDLVVTVCEVARDYRKTVAAGKEPNIDCPPGKHPLLVGAPIHLDWYLPDPAQAAGSEEEVLGVYRSVRDQVAEHVSALAKQGYLAAFMVQRRSTEQIIDSLDEGIIAHDDCGHIYLFNTAAERITGYSRADVLGRQCHTIFAPDGLCGSICPRYSNLLPSSCVRPDYQVTFTNRNGEARKLRMMANPVVDGASRPSGVVLAMRDITEVNELRWELKEKHSFRGMVGHSEAMQEVFRTIHQVIASDYPVLITGESGTGKELVANAIHEESHRAGGPFVAINCGALPENILESELFGHVKGSFTGAIRDKKGRFELAHHGTLFLDEVGELTPSFQVKLLRVVQEKRFEQVGSEKPITVDVRIISATNRDLRTMVRDGTFRDDLYYRLCVVPIHLPPLRARRDDLPLLVEQILADIRRDTGKKIVRLSDDALDLLLTFRWPGNVRELINALQSAAVRCSGEEIEARHLPPEIRSPLIDLDLPVDADTAAAAETRLRRPRNKLNRVRVERALAATGGNKVKAAQLLSVGRATLYRYLESQGE